MSKSILTVDDIAKVCHEANRAYCESLGEIKSLRRERLDPKLAAMLCYGALEAPERYFARDDYPAVRRVYSIAALHKRR